MPFTPRSAAVIRAQFLADWRARYLALGQDLAIEEGTDPYNQADALGIALEPTEYLAGQAANRVRIRGQFGDELTQTAEDDGTRRKPATAARVSLPVTGPGINLTTAVAGATLSAPATAARPALVFVPVDPATGLALTNIIVDGTAHATLTLECTTPGPDGNLPTPTTLTWSTAPSGFASTSDTSGIARQGSVAEGDTDLQNRLIERRRSPPGSGNEAAIRQLLLEFAGVAEVFVHPCMGPDGSLMLGCWTAVVLGPAAGDSTAPGIFFDAPTGSPRAQATIKRFVLGQVDADGVEISPADREGQVPAPVHPDNITIVSPGALDADVTLTVTTSVDFPPSFVGSYVVSNSTSPTTSTFSTTTGIAGPGNPAQIAPEDFISLEVGSAKRGRRARAKVLSAAGTSVVLAGALSVPPLVGSTVYPTSAVYDAVSAAAFAAFDGLGSGDVIDTASRTRRFPVESWGRPATLRASQLIARLMAIPGVTDVDVDFGGGSTVGAGPLSIVRMRTLTIVPA